MTSLRGSTPSWAMASSSRSVEARSTSPITKTVIESAPLMTSNDIGVATSASTAPGCSGCGNRGRGCDARRKTRHGERPCAWTAAAIGGFRRGSVASATTKAARSKRSGFRGAGCGIGDRSERGRDQSRARWRNSSRRAPLGQRCPLLPIPLARGAAWLHRHAVTRRARRGAPARGGFACAEAHAASERGDAGSQEIC